MKKTMVVVEDDPSIREMLSYYFNSVGFEVNCFESGDEYFEAAHSINPSIFILDIMLPGPSGYAILSHIRSDERTSCTPVIMLTARNAEMDRVAGLEQGADDYVVKPFGILELQARVNAVLRRAGEDSGHINFHDLQISPHSREVMKDGRILDLTYKEFELLTLLVKAKGAVLSRDAVLSSIWGYDFAGETRTVDMHIKTLRAKLGDDADKPQYIITVRGVGYKANWEV